MCSSDLELASGMDLRAAIDGQLILRPGERACISTGIRLMLPPGYEAQIRPRSGLAMKFGITLLNSPGTIDADYRGVISVILVNLGQEPFVIRRGDRVAQMVISKVEKARLVLVDKLPESGRGEGGFGHTGLQE